MVDSDLPSASTPSVHSTNQADAMASTGGQASDTRANEGSKKRKASNVSDNHAQETDKSQSKSGSERAARPKKGWPKPEEGWGKPGWWLTREWKDQKAHMQQTIDCGHWLPYYIKEKLHINGQVWQVPLPMLIPSETFRPSKPHPDKDEQVELVWLYFALMRMAPIMEDARAWARKLKREQQSRKKQRRQEQKEADQSGGGDGGGADP